MVTPAVTHQIKITRCPPGDSSGWHRDTVFSVGRLPVSATATSDGWDSPSIAFDDFAKMHQMTRKKHGERRLGTPPWATDDTKLRKLIVRFVEGSCMAQSGESDAERIARTDKRRRELLRPKLQATLDNLCKEYVALKNAGVNLPRQRQLENLIQGHDTELRLIGSNQAALVAAIVYFYYRVGYDSVGTAELVGGLTPVHVRHVLWRLRRVWARIEKEERAPARKIPGNKCRKCGLEAPRRRAYCIACRRVQKRKKRTGEVR